MLFFSSNPSIGAWAYSYYKEVCDTHAKLKSATVGHEHTCCLDKFADIIVISGELLNLDEFSKLWTKPPGKTTIQPLRRGVN